MENNKAIEIKDLVIDYGSSIAVNKINLEVEKGDLVTLLGPSGCGKSTTLNALAGLITTTSGKIYFDGRNVTRFSPKERDIGLVFQSYALYPHMTVYKNIAFPLLANDKFKEEINNKNKEYELEILKFKYESTGLKDFDEKIKAYLEFEKSTKEVEEKIETIKYKANNATKNAKELKKIARIRKEGSIKNTSEEALKFIKENDKLIELIKKEADSIKRTDLSDEQKGKKLSKLREKIQKLNLSSQKKFDDHSVKIKEIKETFKKDFANAKSEEKRILSEVKVWMDVELNKLSVEKNEIDSKLKELSVKSLTEIKTVAKDAKLNEEQKKQLREIENKKKSWKVELDNRVRTVAERVGITSQLEKKVTNLSGGQQQRVAISRTLVKKPKVLLLDEPLSNLDAKMRVQTREWIRDLQQELGITTVFVTHDQEEAMSISDKIVCMSDGHIQQVAEPMFMYHNPANKFVAGFLGMPQMNFFEEGSEITDQIKKLLKNKKAHSFGIRPEHVKVISEAKKNELHPLKLEGEVSITESFGREKLVTLLVGNETIKFFTEITDLDRGDKVKIGFKKERIYMFDNKGFGETLGRK